MGKKKIIVTKSKTNIKYFYIDIKKWVGFTLKSLPSHEGELINILDTVLSKVYSSLNQCINRIPGKLDSDFYKLKC